MGASYSQLESISKANEQYYGGDDFYGYGERKPQGHQLVPANASAQPIVSPPIGGGGKVELSLAACLDILKTIQHKPQPPQNFFISKSVYNGEAQQESIKFHISFEVVLLRSMWTQVKLLPDTVALSTYDIVYTASKSDNNSSGGAGVVSNEESNSDNKTEAVLAANGGACVGVLGDGFYLVASLAGSYHVVCDILVQYQTPRKTGMILDVCRAAHNQLTFTVLDKDVQLKVDPSLNGNSGLPEVKPKDSVISTSVNVMFPPSPTLSIQWTEKAESSSSSAGANTEEKKSKNKLMVTAEQSSLCSVGEGIMIVYTSYRFTIVHGSVSSYDIEISDRVHSVLSVDGLHIKKWEVLEVNPKKPELLVFDGAAATPISKYGDVHKFLRVQLDYGLENTYQMTIASEVVMEGTSADIVIPVFRCLGEEVAREMGYLAVEARTNVEVAELNREGLVMVDISEIPESVGSLASNSLLLGYKFLHPSYDLSLRVKRHSDVEVLIATCDEAYFIATVSAEGKVLHKLILKIRNTQKQYVRIKIPAAYDIWSTSVAGTSVKPARDEEGRVMVPLQKSSGASGADTNVGRFTVELVYIETEERALDVQGQLVIGFASIDLPINNLCVSIFLPNDYRFGQFVGDLREVEYFSKTPAVAESGGAETFYQPQSQSNSHRYSLDSCDDMDYDRCRPKTNKGYSKVVGVLPVKVEMPTSGQEFKFEQLLVMGGKLGVSVEYHRKKNSSYGHRRTRKCACW